MGVNITVNRRTKITVNGVEYDSVDQLPPDVRAAYEKALTHAKITANMSITINGQPSSADDIPKELRGVVMDPFETGRKAFPAWAVLLALLALAMMAVSWLRAR